MDIDPIGPHVRRLDHLIVQSINRGFEALDLTSTQSHVLRYLSEHEDRVVYPRDIERRFGLTHPTVSGVLQRLEAKQLICCTADPDDRRCKRVTLTDEARQYLQEISRFFSTLEQVILRGMSDEEVRMFYCLLDRSSNNLIEFMGKEDFNQ